MTDTQLGILLWNQGTDWPTFERAARRVDELGYEHLWTWDHLYAIFGDPYQPVFEGYTALAAFAMVTSRARLGLMVGAVTFRNPGLVAKMITNLDQMSRGRAMLGIGAAWFELEHTAYGLDFGHSVGERLDWMDEAAAGFRTLLEGEPLTSEPGGHYRFDQLRMLPGAVQSRLPIMIGGGGERKTLRTVANHADMWNESGSVELLEHKRDVLREHCAALGRDPAEIELTTSCKPLIRDTEREARQAWKAQMAQNRTPMSEVEDDETFWIGTPELIAERMAERKAIGFHTFIAEMAAPYDDETLERWIGEVKPMVDGAAPS
jgi:alkanesulfonate monooxygenase SsuD/methylene tetrahydromethanopterin reductase-like flavin-dependent oxidoreductase (luciferase family)